MIEKLLKKIAKKNDGAALPAVIVVSAVLILMIISMTNLSVQQLQVSKHHKNIDYAYIGSDSLVERTFSYIKGYIDHPSKVYMNVPGSVNVNNDGAYAAYVVNTNIHNEVLVNTNGDPQLTDINVFEGGVDAVGSIEDLRLVSFRLDPVAHPKQVFVTIGITVNTQYSRGTNSASNSRVYAQREFLIDKPSSMGMKPAALNGIGDVYAKGYIKANIKGDVKVFGTGPEKAKQPEQYYYGGVYTREHADIIVDGSIFTRSFVRAGGYDDGYDDDGSVIVKKNAVAQGIQIFGNNDRILVNNDAFTFDDLEMNGLNSFIAINRNYFGLSHGDENNAGSYHDASSGIVNSAVVHHPDAVDEALKSKIFINGDVFINGGSFRIDPENGNIMYPDVKDINGNILKFGSPQIEDASSAWDTDVPTYKNFDYDNDPPYHGNITDRYLDWIYTKFKSNNAAGNGNIFQKWTPQADVETWFNAIKPSLDSGVPAGLVSPSKISGLCMYEMAANGTMYFMYKQSDPLPNETDDPQVASDISTAKYVLQPQSEQFYNEALSYLEPSARTPVWNTEWNMAVNAGTSNDWDGYFTHSRDTLKALRTPLLAVTADFFQREYKWDTANIVNTPVIDNSVTKFDYIQDELALINNISDSYVITGSEIDTEIGALYKDSVNNITYISRYINSLDARYASDPDNANYYVVVNDDPTKTLQIDSRMNGIVFSRGKVVMSKGAELKGFMIAAGQGYDRNTNTISGSAADTGLLPTVANENSKIRLDNGDFASVEFRGTINSADDNTTATIDFSDGLDALLDKFAAQGMKVALQKLFYNP